jgi:hypothetical protein
MMTGNQSAGGSIERCAAHRLVERAALTVDTTAERVAAHLDRRLP